ncbi:MAG: hydrogenase maturation nickel metallochaperone HypA [Desulfobacteraceae bacterium]|nr:hydrogenase maturation nickel metallochaperone HypA [Desulfobacteraceae bacterium]
MHELPITETILKIVLAHAEKNDVRRIMRIHLQVGQLSDLQDDWMQRYFDHLSRGTVAEDAKLQIERTPIRLMCEACGTEYTAASADQVDQPCPQCGQKDSRLIGGREYTITNMEVL